MSGINAICPQCGAALVIPPGFESGTGKCRVCGKMLDINAVLGQQGVSTDDIMTWLTAGDAKTQSPAQAGAARPAPAVKTDPQGSRPAGAKPKGQSLRRRFDVRLDHVNEMGAFFHFDARLLYDEDFRSCLPQRCIICGGNNSLSVHLIEWSSKRSVLSTSPNTGYHVPCVVELDRLKGAVGRELLGVLGRVELLPEPFCLPFPYYVCRSCSPVGAVLADVRPAPGGQGENCELGIASSEGACDFAVAACGADSDAPRIIRQADRKDGGSAWRRLPLAVRNRISQWYSLQEGELFLAYITDAEFSKAEAGIAGVVVTDKRFVYRKALAVVEMPFADNIRLDTTRSGETWKVKMVSDAGRAVTLSANESSASQLQSFLQQYGARGYSHSDRA